MAEVLTHETNFGTRLMAREFEKRLKYSPKREFLVDWVKGKGERRLTYKETGDEVYKLIWALKDRGVEKGDMVTIIGYNLLEGLFVALASTYTGFVYSWQNPELPDALLVTLIEDRLKAKVIFFEDAWREKMLALKSRLKSAKYVISLDGPSDEDKGIIGYVDLVKGYELKKPEIEVKPDELHALYMSGGTTGVPKAAMRTHEGSWWEAESLLHMTNIGGDSVFGYACPSFWSTWLPADLWPPILGGCSVVILSGRLDPQSIERIAEAFSKECVTCGTLASVIPLEWASWPEEKARKYDLSCCTHVWHIGITLPANIYRTLKERWGIVPSETLRSCEVNLITQCGSTAKERQMAEGKDDLIRSPGVPPYQVEFKVVHPDTREEVGPGELGELTIRSPGMFFGYYGEPEKTREVLSPDGWFYSGNIAKMDEEGHIFLECKAEDLPMMPKDEKGRYYTPYEAQAAITNLPEIAESALITIESKEVRYGKRFLIIARPKEGVEVPEEKIIETAKKYIPGELIGGVRFRKEPITKTATGKISVRDLAKEYGGI